ncbi:MAG: hypothetical protein JRN62_04240 [Nitrososphaerota archaeon]|jgi:hypothetical protein|nr:hypothetical protein [Nitrososphaerota archaeon]MDG6948813.1 hypothetical protein [Nitrososphaerota archaeon]
MSMQRAHTTRKIEELVLIMAIAFSAPLIVSFVLWVVATTIGAPLAANGAPSVAYGITAAKVANGIAFIWVPASGSGPTFPSGLLNLINDIMDFVAVIVGLLTAIRLAPSLIELGGEGS